MREALSGPEVPDFFREALPLLWLFFSWHLVAIAVPLLLAAVTNPRWFFPVSIFCGLVAMGDFFWGYQVAGWFPGSFILLLVVAALSATTVLLKKEGDPYTP